MSDCNPKRIAMKRAMLRNLEAEFKRRLNDEPPNMAQWAKGMRALGMYSEFHTIFAHIQFMPARYFHHARPKLDWRRRVGRSGVTPSQSGVRPIHIAEINYER